MLHLIDKEPKSMQYHSFIRRKKNKKKHKATCFNPMLKLITCQDHTCHKFKDSNNKLKFVSSLKKILQAKLTIQQAIAFTSSVKFEPWTST